MTSLEELFADIAIDDPAIDLSSRTNDSDRVKNKEWFDDGHMLEVLLYTARCTEPGIDNEPGTRKHKALLNMLALIQCEVQRDPWWNSRIGWLVWWMACYAKYDSGYPLQWCFHFDPLNFYRDGEPIRPVEMCKTPMGDPFNIQGKCIIHPEWYKMNKDNINFYPDSNNLSESE